MTDGLTCEYGSSPIEMCDVTATCTMGSWNVRPPPPGPPGCDPSPPIMCPSSFASVPRGSACDPGGAYCDYPEGRCSCNIPLGGPPPMNMQPVWNCQDPGAGTSCPTPRPRVGAPCTQDGLTCDYGPCTVPGGSEEICMGGVWTESQGVCAAAGAGR